MTEHPVLPGPPVLQTIWKGMPVVDRDGALIGAVKYVREGEPLQASLPAGQPSGRGYFRVAGAGLMNQDRYVVADQIAYTDEGIVRLAVRADELVAERD